MIKKATAILLLAILTASLLTACNPKREEPPHTETLSYESFIGTDKTFAAQIGDIYGDVAKDIFKAKQVQEYTLVPDMLEAVRLGKVDAAILDDAYVKQVEDSGKYPGLSYLPVPRELFVNMASNAFHTESLRDEFDRWLETITADGTFDEIYNRWIGVSLPDEKDIPRFTLTGENGTLRVCNTGNFPPFSYTDSSNRPVGFDEEILCRFAAHLGMDIEYNMMAYDAIIPYVLSGKADMSGCSFTVTDDRSENVIFGTPFAKAKAVLVVKKSDAAADGYTRFAGKDIAVITGVLTYNTVQKINANPVNYNDSSSAAEDVRLGRVDGYMHALTAVQVMAAQLDGFEAIPVPKEIFAAQVAGISYDSAAIDRFNAFLSDITADGTLEDMQNRWFGENLLLDAPIPEIRNSGENGVLKVAICSDSIPYVYVGKDGKYSGFSVELALRFGAYEGRTVEFTDMEFGGLIPYIVSKKADIGLANMAITEERRQSGVLFTEPFFDEQHGILALKQGGAAAETRGFSDFTGMRIGVAMGTVSDLVTQEQLLGTPAYYSDLSAGIEDLRNGRIDGYMKDLSTLRVVAAIPGNEDLEYIEVPPEIHNGPMGAFSMDQSIIDKFNVFLAEIEADGTLAEMQNRWLENIPDLDSPMPEIPLGGGNGTLRVATCGEVLPFSYVGGEGELKGYSIELVLRFAAREDLFVEFAEMEFSAMIPYVVAGKADLGIANVSITEERKKSVLFSDPVFYDQLAIIALRQGGTEGAPVYTGFFGGKIGVIIGTACDQVAEDSFDAEPVYYSAEAAALEDLRFGRIDGYMADASSTRVTAMTPGNEDLVDVGIPAEIFEMPMGAISMNQDIIDRFNLFLAEVTASGVLADMQDYWLRKGSISEAVMPDIPLSGENGTLRIATCSNVIPFAYSGMNGELRGYSIELALRFAAYLGMDIEFIDMDFNGLIPYVVSEKADLGIANISITEERKQSVLFTDSIYNDTLGILALRSSPGGEAAASGGFAQWLKTGIERNLITDNRWRMIVDGLGVTLTIAVLAQLFGTALGCFVCWLLMQKNKLVRGFGNFYCGLIHGTPIVVLLMITYYIIFGSSDISNVLIAVAAFTMTTGAGVARNLKGAIETVDPVEIEAARSIGFSAFKAFMAVTLPQAVRRALPGYTGGFVELVKATAIVGYIAIQDLTRAGDIIRSRTYDAYFPLLLVALIYLFATTLCVQLFKLIIKKINGGEAA